MPAAEIRQRLVERRWRALERRAYRRGGGGPSVNGLGSDVAHTLTGRADELIPGTRRRELAELSAAFPRLHEALREQARDRAEAICGGEHPLLGCPMRLSEKIDWHRDPRSGFSWPRQFYADVEVYGRTDGLDVKYVWELNRHQFLVELSRAWLFTGEDRYAACVRDLLLDWMEENPFCEGVNWTSALEVAVRSISWLWTVAGLAEWPGWRPEELQRVARGLAEHATYLTRHLSFYSSPYNHLVGEATALVLLGRWLRGSSAASEWEGLGRRVLTKHGPEQFHEDGFTVEQATGYHFFTLGFLTQAVLAARRDGRPLSELESAVSRAFGAAGALKQPDGRWPAIGDLDSARSVPVFPDDPWDFRSLCSLGAAACNDPELRHVAERPGEELYWLTGTAGVEAFEGLVAQAPSEAVVLSESGCAVARSGYEASADWLLFDAGPLAHGLHADATPSAAHGHVDPLQLLLFQGGRPVLLDAGIPSYSGDRRWIEHFRGPAAHNTLEIDGEPWARPAGGLAWSHVGHTPRLDANLAADVWLVRGELALPGGTTVVRHVLGLPGRGVWVADLVRSPTPRAFSWYWQLPAGAAVTLEHRNNRHSEVACPWGVLATASDPGGVRVELVAADPNSPAAWQAPTYGSAREALRLAHRADAQTERLVLTCIGPRVLPASVEVGGRTLSLSADQEDPRFAAAEQETPPADVLWSVRLGDELLLVAGGLDEPIGDSRWTELAGTGGWLAARTVVEAPIADAAPPATMARLR